MTEASQPFLFTINPRQNQSFQCVFKKKKYIYIYINTHTNAKLREKSSVSFAKWKELINTYIDKTIVEEETEGAGDCNEGLLEFLGDGIPNNAFNIGADIGVIVALELR